MEKKQIEFNKQYLHYKNKKSYIPVDNCKIQENDLWIDAIIYKADDNNLYVRSKKEFIEKFSLK